MPDATRRPTTQRPTVTRASAATGGSSRAAKRTEPRTAESTACTWMRSQMNAAIRAMVPTPQAAPGTPFGRELPEEEVGSLMASHWQGRPDGQHHFEGRAPSHFALRRDLPAMQRDDPVARGEA